MARTEELSDFKRGTVIGCYCVIAVIVKWKCLGATTAQPWSSRPHKLTEWDRQVLKLPAQMHCANCKVWWRTKNGLGLFFMVPARRYSIQWYSRQFCAFNFVATVWRRLCPVSAWQCPLHKLRSIQKMFVKIGYGRTWPACTEPWPQPHRTPLNEFERQLRARPSQLTSVPNLTNALAQWFPNLLWSRNLSNIQRPAAYPSSTRVSALSNVVFCHQCKPATHTLYKTFIKHKNECEFLSKPSSWEVTKSTYRTGHR
jgi:hypothetical protein